MAPRHLQNDFLALKRKSARFTEPGASVPLIFLAEDDAKAAPYARCGRLRPGHTSHQVERACCALRALWPLAAVVFHFSKNNP